MRRMFSLKQLQEIADARVEALVEGGQLDNAKPIYCHPISIIRNNINGNSFRITALIFNNDDTPFTLATFKEWFDNLVETTESRARLLCTGGVSLSNFPPDETPEPIVVSSFDKATNGLYGFYGMALSGSIGTAYRSDIWTDIFPEGIEFVDGVNKIN